MDSYELTRDLEDVEGWRELWARWKYPRLFQNFGERFTTEIGAFGVTLDQIDSVIGDINEEHGPDEEEYIETDLVYGGELYGDLTTFNIIGAINGDIVARQISKRLSCLTYYDGEATNDQPFGMFKNGEAFEGYTAEIEDDGSDYDDRDCLPDGIFVEIKTEDFGAFVVGGSGLPNETITKYADIAYNHRGERKNGNL